jgi:iron complex transport system ATP-binding protein
MQTLKLNLVSVQLGGHVVLDRLSTTFAPGQVHVLAGPNGAGKSTLLKAMAALLPVNTGNISLNGADVARMTPQHRADHIAYMPQERTIAWDLPAVDVAALGASHLTPEMARQRAYEELTALGLKDVSDRGVFSLSGGQRARVLLARVLASRAGVYLLDEPLTALDPAWQRQVLKRLQEKAAEGATVIVSLHDLPLTVQFADNAVLLKDGHIAASGPPEKVFNGGILRDVFNLSGELIRRDGTLHLQLAATPVI